MRDDFLYCDHKEIMASFSLKNIKKDLDEIQAMEWCQEVENEHIKDVNTMWMFENIALKPESYSDDKYKVTLPCNIYRLINVFSCANDPISHLQYFYVNLSNRRVILVYKDQIKDYVYLNYRGTPIDEDGTPLIPREHKQACITYILMQLYFPDVLDGKFQPQLYYQLENKFSGQMAHVKNSFRHLDAEHANKLNVINGDMIESIGNMRILNQFM